jgi:hypothetical protein
MLYPHGIILDALAQIPVPDSQESIEYAARFFLCNCVYHIHCSATDCHKNEICFNGAWIIQTTLDAINRGVI